MKRLISFLFLLWMSLTILPAQELRCAVQVSAPGVQGTNRNVFQALRESIHEFMNNQQWTDYNYKSSERIECTFNFISNWGRPV
jgi:hypothetical protein